MAVQSYIFAGQSNAQGHGIRIQLDPVPLWARNDANGWEGAPSASSDTLIAYRRPTAAGDTTNGDPFPALYNSNSTGLMAGVFDVWGDYPGEGPAYPSGDLTEESGYGLELSFAWKWKADNPSDTLALVKLTLGGSSIGQWLPGAPADDMHDQLTAMIEQAAARLDTSHPGDWEWAGFIWMHGESGAHSGNVSDPQYRTDLRSLLAYVRGLTRADLPCVLGRIGDNWLGTGASGWTAIDYSITSGGQSVSQPLRDSYHASTVYRRSLQVEVGADANNGWWDNDELPVRDADADPTGYHYSPAGNLAMGERAYAAYAALTAPPAPAVLSLAVGGGSLRLRTGGAG